ncbi:E3 SUMO-protein ligase ZBED1-like isoform 1-T1 [Fundulus diaphanus]
MDHAPSTCWSDGSSDARPPETRALLQPRRFYAPQLWLQLRGHFAQRNHRNMDLISKPRSKSVVWTYFGLKADERGQPLNTGEVICRLCRKIVLAKGGNTTNLRSHLTRRHRADFYELTSFATAGASFEAQGLDLSHEELNEDVPLLHTPSNSNYVPDAVVPPGEPWLHGGPSRAVLSLPACLCLRTDAASSGEEQAEMKVYAKCQLQQGVLFGPFLGELCKGQTLNKLRYAWAIRDDFAFTYVDASDENKSNWMRYVSYTSNEDEHNLVVFQFYRHIYYKVSQPISEGAELKVWIGKDYASLLGLGMGDNAKCEIGDKETALRLLQDIQLVTLPEPSSTALWSDSSQSQSPMPVISEVTTVSNPEATSDTGSAPSSAFPPAIQSPFLYTSSSVIDKYDFLPGSEKLLSNPNAHQHSAWQFFGLEPDPTGRPLDRNTAVCKLCMERVNCGGGATDLQSHLTAKHHLKPRDITKDRILAAGQRIVPVMAPSGVHSGPPAATSAQVTNAITSFLIRDLQSPALVEGEGFKQLLHTLLPSYKELLTSQQLQSVLRDHYIKAKVNLIQLLRSKTVSAAVEEISDYTAPIEFEPRRAARPPNHQRAVSHFITLSVDVWLHSWQGSCQHYLTLWAHYIDDDDFSPRNLALATQRLEEGGAKDLNLQAVETQVKALAQEWGVSQPNLVLLGVEGKHRMRLRPIKTEKGLEASGSAPHPNSTTFLERDDSASPEEPQASPEHFSEGLPSVPCFFSAVQACVEEVMLHPVIFKTLGQFQGVLSALLLPPAQKKGLYHHHARKLLHGLTKAEQDRVKVWAHSQPTWNSLYPSLNALVKHKSLICDIVKDINTESLAREETAGELLGSYHANSTSNASSAGLPTLRAEWKVVEELCLVLKPLDVACRTLAKEAFPRLSLVKPILTGLLSRHLVPRPGDSSSILKEVKRTMRRSLASCYDSPAVNRILCVACSLDPQFHGLGFMDEKEQMATFNWLKKEAVRIAKEDRKRSKANQVKRSSPPVSPESDSELLRRSKRLKECPPINFRELVVDDELSDAGEIDEGEPPDPASQAGLSGMEFLLGDLFCSTPRNRQSSVEESVDMEMSVFRADRGASLGVEPLQWWRTKAVQFPLLASVARVYMAAPAVAGNAAQDFVQEGPGTTNRKRLTIPPESLDAILFLHHNRITITEAGGQE